MLTQLSRIAPLVLSASLAAQDATGWSRFRGPNGSGVSTTTGIPTEIDKNTNVLWRTELPAGHSSPVIWKDRVYITGSANGDLLTMCLARDSGKVLWRRTAPRTRNSKLDKRNNHASPTPAVDAEVVVVFFQDFGLVAYDHDGEMLWKRALGPFDNVYGMGASPVILDGLTYLACDQSTNSYLLAVHKRTGEIAWKVDRPYAKSGHCTPILYRAGAGDPQLILPGSFYLDAYDPKTGTRIWHCSGLSFEMKSVPVVLDDVFFINGYGSPWNQPGKQLDTPNFEEMLAKNDADKNGAIGKAEMPRGRVRTWFDFVDLDRSAGLDAKEWDFLQAALASKNGMLAIRAGGKGDVTRTNTVWSYRRSVPQLPSPLLYGGLLYMLNDQSGILVTLDPKTGKPHTRGRLEKGIDNYYASPVAADGKIWFVSETGIVTVLPKGGSFEPLWNAELDERCYATPAIADGSIYIRTEKALYRFGRAEAAGKGERWPEYRGPRANGHAPDANVPLEWSEKKNIRWKTAIRGTGWSSPVVWDDQIWMTSATEDGREMSVVACDLDSGKVIHERRLFANDSPEPKNRLNSYASPSPVIEAGRVYVHFGTYGTACIDTRTFDTVWERRDIHCDHMEGPGSSPTLVDDMLVVNMDGGDVQYVIALDKKTGKTRWKTERSEPLERQVRDLRKAYSTPIVIEVGGKRRLISSGAQATVGYDPKTGNELWKVRHGGFSMSARPAIGNGLLYLNTGFMRPRLVAVRPQGTGDVTDSAFAWTYRRSVPTMTSPLLIDDRYYMISDGGILTCLNAKTGKPIFKKRIDGKHCASPVYASGRIYFFDREGSTLVIATGDEFKELARNELDDGFMASPAVLSDGFVLRTKTHLYRIGASSKEPTQGSRRQVITPAGTRSGLPFSPAIATGDFVHLSGVIASDRTGDIEAQTREVFAKMSKTLQAAGLDLSHAVKSNVFLTDSRHFARMNQVYAKQFGAMPPVRATVEADLAIPDAQIEVTLVAARDGVAKRALMPAGWPKPTRPYSWGIQAGDTVFLSGIVSRDPTRGQLVLGDIKTQTKQVLANIGALLESADLDYGDVVSSVVYLTDARDFAGMNEVYRSFFKGDAPPARATIRTRLMNPALRVEIQCIAVRDRARKVVIAAGGRRSTSPFSPSIVAGGRQFLAGMVGRGQNGYAAGDIRAQTRQTLQNLQGTLAAAGLDFGDVVESFVILGDARHFAAMNEVYREMLPDAPPARTTIGAQLMSPTPLVEIMMTAARR